MLYSDVKGIMPMRKFFLVSVSILTISLVSSSLVSAETPNDACFTTINVTGGVEIRDYTVGGVNSCPADVDIPAMIGGQNVMSIGKKNNYTGAFENKTITAVTFPSTLTAIDDSAFKNNQLTQVVIPEGVTMLGNYAFANNKITEFMSSDIEMIGYSVLDDNRLERIVYDNSLYEASNSPEVVSEECVRQAVNDSSIIDRLYYANLAILKDTGVVCISRDIIIPSTVRGEAINTVGSGTSFGVSVAPGWPVRSIVLPDTIQRIGHSAFSGHLDIREIYIPGSVKTIDDEAFYGNSINTLTIGAGLESIGAYAFGFNSIESVQVPSTVSNIDPTAFFMQTPYGGIIDDSSYPDTYVYSDNLDIQSEIYNSIFYTRLYTSNRTNPNNLSDGVMAEDWWTGDINNNGKTDDSIGGHLLNPAKISLKYINKNDVSISKTTQLTGQTTTSNYINDYRVSSYQIQAPLNPFNPTPEEQEALERALSAYFRIGQTLKLDPPPVEGYLTPQAQTFVLGAATNQFEYVYQTTTSSDTDAKKLASSLAETGSNTLHLVTIGFTMFFAALYLLIASRRSAIL